MADAKYQLLGSLKPEELAALEQDIAKRGVMVPIEVDETGAILDGHHRMAIAKKLGKPTKTIVRRFKTEGEKREHVIQLNLARRHLEPHKWGLAFEGLLAIRGVKRQRGGDRTKEQTATIAVCAKELGVPPRTAEWRLRQADEYKALPAREREAVDAGKETVAAATRQRKARVRQQRLADQRKQGKQRAEIHHCKATVLLRTIKTRSVDLLLTDPPYSTDVEDMPAFLDEWLETALDTVKDTGRALICTGTYPSELSLYCDRLQSYKRLTLGTILVWTYRNAIGPAPTHDFKANWQAIFHLWGNDAPPLSATNLNEQFSVIDIAAPDGRHGNRWHPWQKPEGLADRLVRLASKPGDLVLDPFAGTGTFCVVAAALGRKAIGSELDAKAVRICKKRGAAIRGKRRN